MRNDGGGGGVKGISLVLAGGLRCGRSFLTTPLSAGFEVIWSWSADKECEWKTPREGERDVICYLGCCRDSVEVRCLPVCWEEGRSVGSTA